MHDKERRGLNGSSTYLVNPGCISISFLVFLILYITVGIPESRLCTWKRDSLSSSRVV